MPEASGPRIPYVPEAPDDPRVRAVFERQRRRWQGAPVLNLYRVLGWAPEVVSAWLEFSSALRFRVTTPAALRELMIVRSGQLVGAEYEWRHHWTIALEAGVPESKLRGLAGWRASDAYDDDERALLALADDTALGNGATEATMRELAARFTHEAVVEYVVTAGFYAGVGRILNSFAVPLEPDHGSMTPRDPGAADPPPVAPTSSAVCSPSLGGPRRIEPGESPNASGIPG